ncbi:MAG: MFS transporter [Planctomycetes bacterium]|nr:MFS transporter [Planctomycetota bacterium]
MTPSVTERTFRLEQFRALASGVIETAGTTFLLLLAVRVFDAGPTAKALIAAGTSVGLLFTPITVAVAGRLGVPATRAAAALAVLPALLFCGAALHPTLPVFVGAALLGLAAYSALVPLLTQTYQNNYPDAERGSRFARTVMIRVLTSAIFGAAVGWALARDLGQFPWLLAAYACAFGGAALCLSRCPSQPLPDNRGAHPFRALRYVKEDRIFRIALASWMFMGFANLLMIPLRVEYLANPRYGVSLTSDKIALLTGVIPSLVRLVMAPVWGRLFDRINFFLMRVLVNIGFLIGILSFFCGETTPWLVLGAIFFGVGNAGGDVAWSLWVTKVAPPERVADYMSVHTFLTGVRSLLAPFAAFWLAAHYPLPWLGLGSAGLIAVASALLVPEFRSKLRTLPGVAAGPALPQEGATTAARLPALGPLVIPGANTAVLRLATAVHAPLSAHAPPAPATARDAATTPAPAIAVAPAATPLAP